MYNTESKQALHCKGKALRIINTRLLWNMNTVFPATLPNDPKSDCARVCYQSLNDAQHHEDHEDCILHKRLKLFYPKNGKLRSAQFNNKEG